ncbi:hypothetical protein T484DRAFT_1824995 [Baffinella frigidus]|nr:hypothetical protein T484DRAFT_1824995 [Cryptophyta sp. CCMP2293]
MRRCSPASASTFLLAIIVLLVAPAASINLKWPGRGGGGAEHGTAGGGGGGAQLVVLFPRDGQVLCDQESLELVATLSVGGAHKPVLPPGFAAVLSVAGVRAAEVHTGALSFRLPGLSDERNVTLALAIFQGEAQIASVTLR